MSLPDKSVRGYATITVENRALDVNRIESRYANRIDFHLGRITKLSSAYSEGSTLEGALINDASFQRILLDFAHKFSWMGIEQILLLDQAFCKFNGGMGA
jgi:hypothetical protein